jgi:hypothetical protein
MFYLSIEQTYDHHRPYIILVKLSPWARRAWNTIKLIGLSCLGMGILIMAYYTISVYLVDAGMK